MCSTHFPHHASMRWAAVLFFTLCVFTTRTSSSRVVLLDSGDKSDDSDWPVSALFDTDTWTGETYHTATNETDNKRAFVSCVVMELNVDNWLFTPVISTKEGQRLHISTKYTIRECGTYPLAASVCKESFALYAKLLYKNERSVETKAENFDPSEWKLVEKFSGDERAQGTVSNGKPHVSSREEIRTVPVNGTGIVFAYRDTGSCVSVLDVKVSYDVCDVAELKYAQFPRTVTGQASTDIVEVPGRCVPNATPFRDGRAPTAFCKADGNWQLTGDTACQCSPGYYGSTSMNACSACAAHTYKPKVGDGDCLSCPYFSASKIGSGKCDCLPGYYRTQRESVANNCTKPPSIPTNIRHLKLEQSSVLLEWGEPSSLGGRREVWYRWECSGCPKGVHATPADARLTSRQLKLTGLEPEQTYTVHVFAENEVSAISGDPVYALIEFRTLPLAPYTVTDLVVEAEQKDGVMIAWHAPLIVRNNDIGYEVEIRTTDSVVVHPTASTYYTALNLHPGLKYEFRVRANVEDWGQWSEPLVYDQRFGKMGEIATAERKDDWKDAAIGDVPAWILVLVALTVVVMMVFMVVVCRRRTINRKQMSDLDVLDTYKQDTMTPDYPSAHRQLFNGVNGCFTHTKVNAPLIPTYGTSTPKAQYGSRFKPYVDPTTYEDPNQALTEFTYDIEPQAVYITSVIGGGEFGDVCMGHLNRSMVSTTNTSGYGSSPGYEKEVETVAIKTLKPGSSNKAKADFLLEASIMGQFAHPNVIRLVGVVTRSEPVMIVTEYMSNGSLDNFLRSRDARGDELGIPRMLDMLRGIAAGMKYLTDKGYVHRDLAARNVLVDESLFCKIADFGLSRGVDNTAEQEYTTNGGKIPVRWTAPEAITHRKFTAASDVWSFGVLMWEVMSFGERPYWEWTNQKVISEIMAGYRLPPPMDTPASLHRLMLWCWKLERHERPSFGQLLALLEKYVRNPELVHADAPLTGPRSAHSMHNIASAAHNNAGYGSVGGSTCSGGHSPPPPPPPMGCPPPPPLEDFLRSSGMLPYYERFTREGITNVHELSRLTHLDFLAFGMMSQEYQQIREALASLSTPYVSQTGIVASQQQPRRLPYGNDSTHTLPIHHPRHSSGGNIPVNRGATMGKPSHDNGFFV